jgi:hypothetical protein
MHRTSAILALQPELRPALPTVLGKVDYSRFATELERMADSLQLSAVEEYFVAQSVKAWVARSGGWEPMAKEQSNYQKESQRALRCQVL